MQMGEDTLFPKVRATSKAVSIAAGNKLPSSIFDGTNRKAQHPISILKVVSSSLRVQNKA
jgi:hypothetical protein